MNQICLIYCTFPDKGTLEEICTILLHRKLIACYNHFDIRAGYFWQGILQSEAECAGILKTKSTHLEDAIKELEAFHPYDTPCILHWEVTANEKYSRWIKDCLQ